MLNLDQCLGAYQPLIFTVAESDIEVLKYLHEHFQDKKFYVYSTTFTDKIPLADVINHKFITKSKSRSTQEVLSEILNRDFPTQAPAETYIFLDADAYIHDRQNIRKIKDIVSRYQMDENFVVNLVFISQFVSVPPALERLGEIVFFDLPGDKLLRGMSDFLTEKLCLKDEVNDKGEVTKVVKPTDEVINNLRGLTLHEVERAYVQSFHIHKRIDLDFIRNFKKSAIAKTDLLSLMDSSVKFEDIGGMDTLKGWIKKSCGGWSIEGQKFGLPLMKGLLLVGLPGCGKSLICKAIGNQWGLPIVQFDPSRIFSSRVGESEGNIRRVLSIVENISPCVMFLDEVEKGFAGSQSSTFSDSGVTARVIGTFLSWMQDCTKPVFTVATSNNIHYLPPELIQRFDEKFFVSLPQMRERIEIYRIHLSKLKRDPSKFDLEALSQASQDLSGREIEQALREAMYDAFHDGIDISTQIILKVLAKKTSLLITMSESLKSMLTWVGWDKDKKDGIRARFAHPVEEDNLARLQDQINQLIQDVEKEGNAPGVENGPTI